MLSANLPRQGWPADTRQRTPDDIANRLGEHLRAGANHVAIQVLGGSDKLVPTLSELAGALGLTPRP